MKLHRDLINTPFSEDILKKAERLGMNVIDYNKKYILTKVKTKTPNPYGYNNGDTITGFPYLIGNKNHVALFFEGSGEWFKTSSIVEFEATSDDGIYFETENSYYKLTPISFMVG